MWTSIKQRLSTILLLADPDEVLAEERSRNEAMLSSVAAIKKQLQREERDLQKTKKGVEKEIKLRRQTYANEARSLLDEFDSIAVAQHYYQEACDTLASQKVIAEHLRERELEEYGYIGKKLASVSLHFEALRSRMHTGLNFSKELSAALEDAESDDVRLVAAPLQPFGQCGIPRLSEIQVTAFNFACAMEQMGKATVRPPTRTWLDVLKLQTWHSPTEMERYCDHARRAAQTFSQHISSGQFAEAVALAEDVVHDAHEQHDAAAAELDAALTTFRHTVVPTIAANIFLSYARASLNASRFACVERLLKE